MGSVCGLSGSVTGGRGARLVGDVGPAPGGDVGGAGWTRFTPICGRGWSETGVGGARPGGDRIGVGGARPGGDRMGLSTAGVTRVGLRGATAVAPSTPVVAKGSVGSLRGAMLPGRAAGRGIRLEAGCRGGSRGTPPTGERGIGPPRGCRGRVVLNGGEARGPIVDAFSSPTSSSDEV